MPQHCTDAHLKVLLAYGQQDFIVLGAASRKRAHAWIASTPGNPLRLIINKVLTAERQL